MIEFRDALVASNAHPEVAVDLFAPFIGSWNLLVIWYDDEGRETRRSNGEWHFSRVLEGRAVQDVWIVPSRGERTRENEYEYGTSLRFALPDGSWSSTWIGPKHGAVQTFVARGLDDVVSLQTLPGSPKPMRWEFYNITADAFEWRNIHLGSPDRLVQRFHATRRRP